MDNQSQGLESRNIRFVCQKPEQEKRRGTPRTRRNHRRDAIAQQRVCENLEGVVMMGKAFPSLLPRLCHPERSTAKSKDLAGSFATLSSGDTPQRPEMQVKK